MLLMSLLLACGPKTPPEGSIDISQPEPPDTLVTPAVGPIEGPKPMPTGDGPLPLGNALPFEGAGETPAQKSFVGGEALLQQLRDLPEARNPSDSKGLAVEATKLAEQAVEQFLIAGEDAELRAPAATRTGDAYRMAAQRTRLIQPPMHVTGDGAQQYLAETEEVAQGLDKSARDAYIPVLASQAADPRWKSHARWAMAKLDAE